MVLWPLFPVVTMCPGSVCGTRCGHRRCASISSKRGGAYDRPSEENRQPLSLAGAVQGMGCNRQRETSEDDEYG